MMLLDHFKSLSPPWWGAIAGAVVAGTSLLPDHRLIGGLAAGAAMLFIAKRFSAPCCADCAGAGQGAPALAPEPAPSMPSVTSLFGGYAGGACTSCAGGLS